MTENLQELKMLIRDLIIEVGDLKERVQQLEQNQYVEPNLPDKSDHLIRLESEQYGNIGRIYMEGYHVCNIAYGRQRNGECLFCNTLIHKE